MKSMWPYIYIHPFKKLLLLRTDRYNGVWNTRVDGRKQCHIREWDVRFCDLLLFSSRNKHLRLAVLFVYFCFNLSLVKIGVCLSRYFLLTDTLMQRFPKFYGLRPPLECFINVAPISTRINSNKQIRHKVQLMNNILFCFKPATKCAAYSLEPVPVPGDK
jgi:hypothetical protein